MKCSSLSQFKNNYTRLLRKAFDNAMFQRLVMCQIMLEDGESLMEKFKSTMDMFGSAEQTEAYDKLLALMRENPEYVSDLET